MLWYRILMCVFAVLFMGQTIAATADEHSIHQEQETHLSFDANHQKHAHQAALDVENNQEPLNCHDCGHCHTPANIYLFTSVTKFNLRKNSHDDKFTYLAVASYLISPEHRPPIA